MNRTIAIVIILFSAIASLKAENNYITIDTVISFKPGTGQDFGQDPKYYPQNIFKKPYAQADSTVPCADPEHLMSLGLNGEIIVAFKNYKIINKPGVDFIIYENVMYSKYLKRCFVEPAEVSVSADGITFIPFPFDTLTLKGCAGLSPTIGKMVDIDILKSGGDGFDISKLGLGSIKYIKIKDVSSLLLKDGHPLFDAAVSGFDLNSVVGVNFEKTNSDVVETISPNFRDLIKQYPDASIVFHNILGEKILSDVCANYAQCISTLPKGIYIFKIQINNQIEYFKINI